MTVLSVVSQKVIFSVFNLLNYACSRPFCDYFSKCFSCESARESGGSLLCFQVFRDVQSALLMWSGSFLLGVFFHCQILVFKQYCINTKQKIHKNIANFGQRKLPLFKIYRTDIYPSFLLHPI